MVFISLISSETCNSAHVAIATRSPTPGTLCPSKAPRMLPSHRWSAAAEHWLQNLHSRHKRPHLGGRSGLACLAPCVLCTRRWDTATPLTASHAASIRGAGLAASSLLLVMLPLQPVMVSTARYSLSLRAGARQRFKRCSGETVGADHAIGCPLHACEPSTWRKEGIRLTAVGLESGCWGTQFTR